MQTIPIVHALADGFRDGGCALSANYPGFHSHELHAALSGGVTSVDEKTAYAFAWGASLAGSRAVVSMKNVGLNDAADAFLNSIVTGVNAGLVLALFDDCDVWQSQNRMDTRHYFDFYGGLWLEPESLQAAYDMARVSLEWSERFATPVVLRITNILCGNQVAGQAAEYDRSPPQPPSNRPQIRAPERFVVHPSHAAAQEAHLHARRRRIEAFVETFHRDPPPEGAELNLVFGPPRNLGLDRIQWVQLRSLPLPRQYLGKLLADGRRPVVYEHGDGYVHEKIAALLSGHRLCSVRTNNNDGYRPEYRCSSDYETLFGVLRSVPGCIVCGDLGGFTMDPSKTLDACLCYGTSIAVAVGAAAAGAKPVFAVTGDAAFLHSGKPVLAEAVARGLALTVVVFDNGGAQETGGQAIPGVLDVSAEGVCVHRVDYDSLGPSEWHGLLLRCHGVTAIIVKKRT